MHVNILPLLCIGDTLKAKVTIWLNMLLCCQRRRTPRGLVTYEEASLSIGWAVMYHVTI